MSEKFLLGIDAGTSMVKAIVFNLAGQEVACVSKRLSIEIVKPGWAEQDMDSTWEAVRETIGRSLKKYKLASSDIAAVGLAGQGDGCRLIDKHLRPVRKAILWLDGRAIEIVTRWEKEGINSSGFPITGSAIFAGTPAAVIKWLEKNEPYSLKQAEHFLFAKDWIKLKLTDCIVTDQSDASRAPTDIQKRAYSDELFKLLGLSPYQKLFPRIVSSMEVIGEVTSKASQETGLKKGTPVISGMIDVAATPVGLGVIEPGQAFSVIGTTSFHAVISNKLILDPPGVGMTIAYFPGRFIRSMPSMAGTPNLDWFIREFCDSERIVAKERGESIFELLEKKVRGVPLGAEGVLYHPYINPGGERAPFVKASAKAQFFGIGLRHSRWHLLRSIYEGVALAMLDCFTNIPIQISEIAVSGGGAKSDLWCQIFADATGKVIRTPQATELGALGAAISAGVGVGIYSSVEDAVRKVVKLKREYYPNPENHQKYQQLHRLYQSLYQHLWDDWDLRVKVVNNP